jgi:hypothetical protein
MNIDFEKLPKELKNMFINIILIPFWYISIYLFENELYVSGDTALTLSVCVTLTFTISALFALIFSINNKNEPPQTPISSVGNMTTSAFVQSVIMSVLIYGGHLFKSLTGYVFYFNVFILAHMTLIAIFFIILLRPFSKKTETQSKE